MTTLHLTFLFSSYFSKLLSIIMNRSDNPKYFATNMTKRVTKTHYNNDSHRNFCSIFFSNTMSTNVYPTINWDNFDTSTTCSKQKFHSWGTSYKFISKFILVAESFSKTKFD